MDHNPNIIVPNANLRDLGGNKTQTGMEVKTGYLFRSGHLSELGEEDFKQFKKPAIKNDHRFTKAFRNRKVPNPEFGRS